MVKYSCEKCGKPFTQKSHYTKHMSKKNPCIFKNIIGGSSNTVYLTTKFNS